jgi:L-fucose isomerase-like protein
MAEGEVATSSDEGDLVDGDHYSADQNSSEHKRAAIKSDVQDRLVGSGVKHEASTTPAYRRPAGVLVDIGRWGRAAHIVAGVEEAARRC